MNTTRSTAPRRGRWGRALGTAAALAAVAVTTAMPAGAASSTGTIVPASTPPSVTVTAPVPATCGDTMLAVDTLGRASSVSLEGKTLSYKPNFRGSMGYQPLDVMWTGGMGEYRDNNNWSGTNTATVIKRSGQLVSTSHLYAISGGKVTQNSWRVERTWGSGWQNTEDLTKSLNYYYRLTPDGYLFRYTGSNTTGKTQVFKNGTSLRTVEFDRTINWQGGKADVVLTNLSNGTLREYIIPHTTPTQWSSRNIKTAGWAGFRQFSTMPCGEKGRVIMGYHDHRTVGVYYDPNSYDFNGGDITGRMTTLPALPAGTLAYG